MSSSGLNHVRMPYLFEKTEQVRPALAMDKVRKMWKRVNGYGKRKKGVLMAEIMPWCREGAGTDVSTDVLIDPLQKFGAICKSRRM